jgi:uncharacterized membrane protein YkvA (DUF1232 family)
MVDADQQPKVTYSEQTYSEEGFWEKLKQFAAQAGQNVVEKALTLYFAAQRPETPMWAKLVIYSSLAYFVLPTDVIPDFTPLVGYSDDLSTIVSALAAVAMSITPEVKEEARQKAQEWFGPQPAPQRDCPQASDTIREIAIE